MVAILFTTDNLEHLLICFYRSGIRRVAYRQICCRVSRYKKPTLAELCSLTFLCADYSYAVVLLTVSRRSVCRPFSFFIFGDVTNFEKHRKIKKDKKPL